MRNKMHFSASLCVQTQNRSLNWRLFWMFWHFSALFVSSELANRIFFSNSPSKNGKLKKYSRNKKYWNNTELALELDFFHFWTCFEFFCPALVYSKDYFFGFNRFQGTVFVIIEYDVLQSHSFFLFSRIHIPAQGDDQGQRSS